MKRMYASIAFALMAGCSSRPPGTADTIDAISKRPIQSDQQAITVAGVLVLTSEGYFLFPRCEDVRDFDIKKAVLISQIDSDKLIEIGAVGAFVEVDGTFLMADPKKVNPMHRLVGLRAIRVISSSPCFSIADRCVC